MSGWGTQVALPAPAPARAVASATRLNLGCGFDYREGWWNVDTLPYGRMDQRLDVLEAPWDLPENHFELVYASHVLEHVPPLSPRTGKDGLLTVLGEVWRILRPGGRFEIVGPHPALGWEYFGNPTHYRVVGPSTFDYFDPAYTSHVTEDMPVRFAKESVEVTKRVPLARHWLPLGKSRLGLTQHLAARVPFLRPLVNRVPAELRIVLRKV